MDSWASSRISMRGSQHRIGADQMDKFNRFANPYHIPTVSTQQATPREPAMNKTTKVVKSKSFGSKRTLQADIVCPLLEEDPLPVKSDGVYTTKVYGTKYREEMKRKTATSRSAKVPSVSAPANATSADPTSADTSTSLPVDATSHPTNVQTNIAPASTSTSPHVNTTPASTSMSPQMDATSANVTVNAPVDNRSSQVRKQTAKPTRSRRTKGTSYDTSDDIKKEILRADKVGYCDECDIPAEICISVYVCPRCSKELELPADLDTRPGTIITIGNGPNAGRKCFSSTPNTVNVQKKTLLNDLNINYNRYMQLPNHKEVSKSVILAVVSEYNKLQSLQYNSRGVERPFVKRSTIKNEILATLLSIECTKEEKCVLSDVEISRFMNLPNGFARGRSEVHKLSQMHHLNIDVDIVSVRGYINTYMNPLNIYDENYKSFVNDITVQAENSQVSVESEISSRVVGSVWILITKIKSSVSAERLEQIADKKKNTFMKFANEVLSPKNVGMFVHVFNKHQIPL